MTKWVSKWSKNFHLCLNFPFKLFTLVHYSLVSFLISVVIGDRVGNPLCSTSVSCDLVTYQWTGSRINECKEKSPFPSPLFLYELYKWIKAQIISLFVFLTSFVDFMIMCAHLKTFRCIRIKKIEIKKTLIWSNKLYCPLLDNVIPFCSSSKKNYMYLNCSFFTHTNFVLRKY